MKIQNRILFVIIATILLLTNITLLGQENVQDKPRALEIPDMLEWKSIRYAIVSNDGKWFAHALMPAEGDGNVIIKQLKGDKEYRFDVGESGGRIAFSEDSKWIAFSISPKKKEVEKLKKQKKKVYNDMGLVKLESGEKTDFEKVKRFSFAEENPAWLAMHQYAPESQNKEKEKWKGSDLILYDLATANLYNIGNVSEFSFNKTGQWLAMAIDAFGQSGNSVQLRLCSSGNRTLFRGIKIFLNSMQTTTRQSGCNEQVCCYPGYHG